jgi:hypothetical protein
VKRGKSASSPSDPHFTLKALSKEISGSLFADGWIKDMPCHVSKDTEASVTTARLILSQDSLKGR